MKNKVNKKMDNETKRALITMGIMVFVILLIVLSFVVSSNKGKNIINNLEKIYNLDEISLLYVGSSSCGVCEIYDPIIDKASTDNNFTFYYIDMDDLNKNQTNQLVSILGKEGQKFGTPYTVLLGNGKVIAELSSYVETNELIDFLIENEFLEAETAQKEETSLNMINYSEYNELLESNEKIIIVLAQTTCGACITAKPFIEEIASEKKDITINYFNVDKMTTDEYGLFKKSLTMFSSKWYTPTIIIVKGNEVLDSYQGFDSKEKYLEFLESNGF